MLLERKAGSHLEMQDTKQFTDEQIRQALRLKQLGLPWKPQAGHFLLDPTGFCQQPSPFQPGVFFILNYDYFMKKVGGVEKFKEIMVWLPSWSDARELLRQFDVEDTFVAQTLAERKSIEHGNELTTLLDLLTDVLRQRQTS